MASQDMSNKIVCKAALTPRTISSSTTTSGSIVDTSGAESVTFVMALGTVTDGDYLPLIYDGDDSGLSDGAAVDDAYLIGTEAAAGTTDDTDDNQVTKIGYIGKKRYVQFRLVSTNVSSGAVVGAVCLLGNLRKSSTDQNATD